MELKLILDQFFNEIDKLGNRLLPAIIIKQRIRKGFIHRDFLIEYLYDYFILDKYNRAKIIIVDYGYKIEIKSI